MIRLAILWVIACCVILAGGFALNFLANEPGTITIDYADRVWQFSPLQASVAVALGLMVLMAAFWIVKLTWALIRFLFTGDDRGFGGFFTRSRERAGLDALARGMVALEEGDVKTAKKKLEKAENKLRKPSLTRLMNARAAEMSGDKARAETYYKALMADPNTAFVGTRGLLEQAMASEDGERALKLANHAAELKPKDEGTLDTLYTLQSRKFDWAAARKTLTAQRKAKHLPKLEADRREAGLMLAQAEDAEGLGETEHARQLAVDAAKLDPTNGNAITTAVRMLIESGSKRTASKLVQDGWRAKPQPQLAAAYASIEPDEAPAARLRRFQALFGLHPQHPETHYLNAELALMDKDWTTARKAIEQLRETEPTARTCAIMAAVSRGEGEPDAVVRGWLARALGAPRDGASDSLLSSAAMLPLLVEPNEDEVSGTDEPDDSAATAADETAPEDTADQGTGAKPASKPVDDTVEDAETADEPKRETA